MASRKQQMERQNVRRHYSPMEWGALKFREKVERETTDKQRPEVLKLAAEEIRSRGNRLQPSDPKKLEYEKSAKIMEEERP